MCTAFTPQLTEFLAKNGEKSAVLVSSDFTQAPGKTLWDFHGNFTNHFMVMDDGLARDSGLNMEDWTDSD